MNISASLERTKRIARGAELGRLRHEPPRENLANAVQGLRGIDLFSTPDEMRVAIDNAELRITAALIEMDFLARNQSHA